MTTVRDSKTVSTEALPAEHQWVTEKRRTRSWEKWAKGVVYNRGKNSVQVRKEVDVEKARYIACDLPPHRNTVSLFLNSNESKAYIGRSSRKTQRNPEDEQVFIGVLDLDMLSVKDKVSRLCGNLKTLYVEKQPEYGDWKDAT